MRLFHGLDNAEIAQPTVLTLGVFDGLHLGHQLIIRTVVERACAVDAVPTVVTFDPHPRKVLHPLSAPPLLQSLDQKVDAFALLGIKQTIVIRFTLDFARIRAQSFLRDIVRDRLQAREVYLGRGFAFGHNREGNIQLLREASKHLGFYAEEVPEVRLGGQRISSTRIRQSLAEGKLNPARRMLGRPYDLEGRVARGHQRGRTIGFPTANLAPQDRVIPRHGVYVTLVLIAGKWHPSISNVGTRPTFGADSEPSVESFIIGFTRELYGDVVRVRFLHRLRDERTFASIEDLKSQIGLDRGKAIEYFSRAGARHMLDFEELPE